MAWIPWRKKQNERDRTLRLNLCLRMKQSEMSQIRKIITCSDDTDPHEPIVIAPSK